LFTWLAFRRRGFNYAEHLTANMMFIAFSNLIFTLIVFPLGKWITPFAMILQALYLGWALNGFLQLNNTGQRLKSFGIAILVIILWAVFSITLMAIYIYRDWNFYEMFRRMGG